MGGLAGILCEFVTMSDVPALPFDALEPDRIIDAVEGLGFLCDRRLLALNSYENRVYQVGIEDGAPVIAKFYRPGRWSDAQIREEHAFVFELDAHELPVVAPLTVDNESLFQSGGFRFALFPRQGGHAPELDDPVHLAALGRVLGRMHRIGAVRAFGHRPHLTPHSHGYEAVAFVAEHFIPAHLAPAYSAVTRDLLAHVDDRWAQVPSLSTIRTHGDCHVGNVLWREAHPHFVDFDDARTAPAVQDLWMLLSGEREQRSAQLVTVLDGYTEFADFDVRELALIETLRTLRMLNYSAWLGRRWREPAFQMAFPWFDTTAYWESHVLELKEQLAALAEPPLELMR